MLRVRGGQSFVRDQIADSVDNMSQIYEHHLQTGSGWTRVTFHLDEHEAVIMFDSRWMGSDPKRYKLNWIHKKMSSNYGLLTLRSIERFTSMDSDETVVEDIRKFGYYDDEYDSELPEHVKEIIPFRLAYLAIFRYPGHTASIQPVAPGSNHEPHHAGHP